MSDTVKSWMLAHTTPRIVIGLLLVTGIILVAAASFIIALYPEAGDKNPMYYVAMLGLFIVGYAAHKRRVNVLLRDLSDVIDKGKKP